MTGFHPFEFEGPVEYYDVGSDRYRYTVVFVPTAILKKLPLKEHPRLRIEGEINDIPIEASLTPAKGRYYVLLSRKFLKEIESAVGDLVFVRFSVGDQDAVDTPEVLQEALRKNRKMQTLWDKQTAGKQRGLAYRVASAKRPETQQKRIAEVFDILTGKRDAYGKLVR